jgi:para-nitrobenzyl esterase
MAAPTAKGLFARAIAQSPFLGMIRTAETSRRLAERFGSLLGQQTDGIANALARADPHDLVAALEQLTAEVLAHNPGDMSMIGATIDGDFLPSDPFDAIEQGQAHQVPFIVGHTADEATVFNRFVKVLPTTASAIERALAEVDPAQRRAIYRSYPNYPDAAACVLLCGDMCFGTAAWRLAEAHARHAPTFLYRYDFAPRTLQLLGLHATHGSDLLPLFDTYRTRIGAALTVLGHRRPAQRVSDAMQSRWLAFSQAGCPGPDWPPYNDVEHPVFILDTHSHVEFDPHHKRRKAWEGFRIPR